MPRAKKTEEKEPKKTTAKTKKEAVKKVATKKPAKTAKETKKVAPKAVKETKVKKTEVKKAEKTEKVVEKVEKKKVAVGKDTGSVEAQIDVFSKKIKSLTGHLKHHIHDFDSKRGLLIMVGKRRRLLNYLKKKEPAKYEKLVKNLKLKK